MQGQALQFLGSLAAILVLAALAWRMGLGPAPHLASEEEARSAAAEAIDGFDPSEIALDREGRAALLCDAAGRVLLLRGHGSHFAGRLLTPAASAHLEGDSLLVDTAERRFGTARLAIAQPHAWVRRIEAIV